MEAHLAGLLSGQVRGGRRAGDPFSHGMDHRVLSFSTVVGIGTPPTPHPRASVLPPFGSGGGAHSMAREGVGLPWESPNSDAGTHTIVLYIQYIRTLWYGPIIYVWTLDPLFLVLLCSKFTFRLHDETLFRSPLVA